MVDVLTSKQRSYNMSMIRSSGTKPEILLRDMLFSAGINSFKMHVKDIIGKPDFYFPDQKKVLFVDGCFWHGCKRCFIAPATNKKFWDSKIKSNLERDNKVNRLLKKEGIKVIRIKEHDLKKEPEKVMEKVKTNLLQKKSPKVLDLFAGIGGLSEGFIRNDCEIIGHIEMDKKACSTLVTRMIYHALVKQGRYDEYKNYVLGTISRDELVEKYKLQNERDSVICAKIGKDNYKTLIKQIKKRLNGGKLDFIIGGPPCQAYSYIGRARDINNMRRDERNFLYRYYVEFLKALKPKIFIFENVPGLKSAGNGRYLKDMRSLMKKAGYDTDYRILNAADYGVPQNRKRIILIGWNKDSELKKYPNFPEVVRDYLVKDFFVGLPNVQAGKGLKIENNFSIKNELLEKLGIINSQFDILMDHISRPNSEQDLEIYRLAVQAKQSGENIKYNNLPDRLKTHKNESGFLDRFKVVDINAKGSHTVVAHIAKDGHFYIHPDIKQNRSLTVREAARLQAFPDDYKFEGERGAQFKQIGNAVSPMLSEILARFLVSCL